jgi:FKBP-type peptidyl-prolyl cis-trans isomerase
MSAREESKMSRYWILIVIVAVLAAGVGVFMRSRSTSSSSGSAGGGPTAVSGAGTTTATGLQYWDITMGTGTEAAAGKEVKVHYTGWLTDGQKFDSSVDRGEPFTFHLGAGEVIPGWDQGVAGMKVGGKRQLKIPPTLGYGERGAGGVIPPNATLVVDVQLLGVGG